MMVVAWELHDSAGKEEGEEFLLLRLAVQVVHVGKGKIRQAGDARGRAGPWRERKRVSVQVPYAGKENRPIGLGLRWPGSWASAAEPATTWTAGLLMWAVSLGQTGPKFKLEMHWPWAWRMSLKMDPK